MREPADLAAFLIRAVTAPDPAKERELLMLIRLSLLFPGWQSRPRSLKCVCVPSMQATGDEGDSFGW